MKKTYLIVLFIVAQVLMCACSQKKGGEAVSGEADSTLVADTLAIERFNYVDSAKYAYLTIDIELPQAKDDVAETIRGYLLNLVGDRLSYVGSYESERSYLLGCKRYTDGSGSAIWYILLQGDNASLG